MGRKPKQPCLTLYPEIEYIAENLSDTKLGALIRALIQYRYHGVSTDFEKDPMLQVLFTMMRGQVDRLEEVKQRNTENAMRRWARDEEEAPAEYHTNL